MPDKFSPEKRTQIMSRIKGKNTKPEIIIRKLVFSLGYRYRIHYKKLPGKPDIAFPGRKKVVFIHGCFWHGHSCPRGALPETNKEFWKKKITGNIQRDEKNIEDIIKAGWDVLTIWQCEIKKSELDILANRIQSFLG